MIRKETRKTSRMNVFTAAADFWLSQMVGLITRNYN